MWVKVCGITRLEDARLAAECGASAIGFVFWPGSPRFVDPDDARVIRKGLPKALAVVGVFVNQPVEEVRAISKHVGLDGIQLHGDETPGDFGGIGLPLIRAVPTGPSSPDGIVGQIAPEVLVLVDAADPRRRGGTGITADWPAAAAIASRRATILAGGLTPWNVAEAIAAVRPFGVDVSSGVETAPGLKDADLVRRFVLAASTPTSGGSRP